jgi:hypothetical protein
MKGAHHGKGECGGDDDDLSRFSLLRCQGGGPLEAAEDEGLPIPCEEVEMDGGGGVAPDSFVPKLERKRKREEGSTRAWERRKGGITLAHGGRRRGPGPTLCGRAVLATGWQRRVRVRLGWAASGPLPWAGPKE